jgi:hypothetical protein
MLADISDYINNKGIQGEKKKVIVHICIRTIIFTYPGKTVYINRIYTIVFTYPGKTVYINRIYTIYISLKQ